MKMIQYKILQSNDDEDILLLKQIGYNEVNEQIAKAEAYNAEYTIEEIDML